MTKSNLKSRHKSERRFKLFGVGAIGISFIFLIFLMFNIISNGIGGFFQTRIKLDVNFDSTLVEEEDYSGIIRQSFNELFPELTEDSEKAQIYRLVSGDAKFVLQHMVEETPLLKGTKKTIWLPASQDVDIFYGEKTVGWEEVVSPEQQHFIEVLKDRDRIASKFNSSFFTQSDSQEPESAGIAGAMIGTVFLIIACMLIALPIGILTAIYLEEFAPKNRITDLLEININNLAAVPSIVFGLLGLAVYLNFLGMPRSAPIVGGMTLALMVIPVIIIATRASIKAVPPSIRSGAMALGASPLQVVLHHTLPLSMPGIMTGTILGIARAMGETAPLLMIGMVAFIADIPGSFTDPATAMPVQIFLWSKNNQPGFVEKTAAAIMVLLAILILMNIIAVWIRKKYERRW